MRAPNRAAAGCDLPLISVLAIYNYRSLRDFIVPLGALNVITGPNGSGKSNIYRALRLLADIAQGQIIPSLAREGGLQSTLWAGPESFSRAVRSGELPVQGTARKEPVSLRLGFAGDEFSYAIDLGLPSPSTSAFAHDPEIKCECVWNGEVLRPSAVLVERTAPIPGTRPRCSCCAKECAAGASTTVPCRPRRARAPAADRHAHAGARQ